MVFHDHSLEAGVLRVDLDQVDELGDQGELVVGVVGGPPDGLAVGGRPYGEFEVEFRR